MHLVVSLGASYWVREKHAYQQCLALLGQMIKGIFPQGRHYKYGFGNDGIMNVMASD